MLKMLRNLVLIGMPGAGKSTIGVILAKQLSLGFVDTDLLIQTAQQRSLQQILDDSGYLALRQIEETVILRLCVRNHVIATGGSAVYSAAAMAHLKNDGIVVFLQVSLPTLYARVQDFETRGIAKRPEQSFTELFEERSQLYQQYADLILDCNTGTHEDVCRQIIMRVTSQAASSR